MVDARPLIAVLGANGQVGGELCLALADDPRFRVRGVVRSAYGAALLRLAGVDWAEADASRPGTLDHALRGSALVLDLTYPRGQMVEIPTLLEEHVDAVLGAMPRDAIYAHTSSISAFGMGSGDHRLRDHLVPRSSYAAIKRRGEKIVAARARTHGVEAVIFRLGQVHGVLQGVTRALIAAAELRGEVVLGAAPHALTNAIFVDGIADALRLALDRALGADHPLTLVSSPQWTAAELASVYASITGLPARCAAPVSPRPAWLRVAQETVLRGAVREMLETHVLLRAPSLFPRAKGAFRRRAAAIGGPARDAAVPPLLVGPAPHLVPTLASRPERAVATMRAVERRIRASIPIEEPPAGPGRWAGMA